MSALEPVLLFTRRFAALGLEYMVTGSVATVVYGEPRLTLDVELEYHREGGSEKHLRDIASVVRLSGDDLDEPVLEGLCAERGLLESWRRVRASAD